MRLFGARRSAIAAIGLFAAGLVLVSVVVASAAIETRVAPPKFKLKVAVNGTGSGTVTSSPAGIECKYVSPGPATGACEENYKEGTKVKLTGTPATGSKAVVWESCPGTVSGENKCEVTMSAAKEAKATFNLIPEAFSTTVEGEGKVECEDNGGGLKPCASSYLYGHTIKVVATAAKANELASLSGTGSAAGKCAVETETTGSCTFQIKEASSVTAEFKTEKPAIDTPATIVFEGAGAGWVKGTLPEGEGGGTPYLQCHWNGAAIDTGMDIAGPNPKPGICETRLDTVGGLTAIGLKAEPDPGSELVGWVVEEGTVLAGCGNPAFSSAEECPVASFGGVPVKVKAIFAPAPTFKLKVAVNGTGSGTVTSLGIECKYVSPGPTTGDCEENHKEGTKVQLTATPSAGSAFKGWTTKSGNPGTCTGTTSPCEVTMNTAVELEATFDLIPEPFSVTVIGEGKVECEDNGGGLKPCASSYLYGHTIKVVATADPENAIASLSGTGSAAGKCKVETETTSSCTFEIKETSSVTAEFKTLKPPHHNANDVFGEVPQTTTLESTCETLNLGEFKPGVTANYSKTCALTLTSTGEETTLAAKDESATHTGHLVQGSYFLPSALKAKATDSEAKGTGPGLTALKESNIESLTLLTFKVPVGKDASTVEFSQDIGEHDGLHTGVYSKTITLILEQTKP